MPLFRSDHSSSRSEQSETDPHAITMNELIDASIITHKLVHKKRAIFQQLVSNALEAQDLEEEHHNSRSGSNNEHEECSICLSPIFQSTRCTLSCSHSFHIPCINSLHLANSRPNVHCPLCRTSIGNITSQLQFNNTITSENDIPRLMAMRKTTQLLGSLFETTHLELLQVMQHFSEVSSHLPARYFANFRAIRGIINNWFEEPQNMTFRNNTSDDFDGWNIDELSWQNVQFLEDVVDEYEPPASINEALKARDLENLVQSLLLVRISRQLLAVS